jgi:hypothetical protein
MQSNRTTLEQYEDVITEQQNYIQQINKTLTKHEQLSQVC